MKFNLKNWKTTVAAVIAIIVQFGPVLFPNYIDEKTANTISVVAASLGVGFAKDHNVTGGTVANVPNDASAVKETAKKDA